MLKEILNKAEGGSLAAHFGLSAIKKFKRIEHMHQAFVQTVSRQYINQWPQLLRQLTRNKLLTIAELIQLPKLLGKNQNQGLGYIQIEGQFHLWPRYKPYVNWLQQCCAKALKRKTVFYIYDYMEAKHINPGADDNTPILPLLLTEPSHKLKHWLGLTPCILNDILRTQQEGRSQHQLFLSLYQQLQEVGSRAQVLIAHPRTLQNFCLFVAQQRGAYTPLKELLPNLEIYCPTILDTSVYDISLQYCFNGQHVHKQALCADGLLPIFQYDLNVQHHMRIPTGYPFYEFIPEQDILPDGKLAPHARSLRLKEVNVGSIYAVVASFPNGLLRQHTEYLVKIQNKDPLDVKWMGTLQPMNGFGEALSLNACHKAIQSINDILHNHGLFIRDYIIGFNHKAKYHEWVIELSRPVLQQQRNNLVLIARRLYAELELNHSTYRQILRNGRMQPPRIRFIGPGYFSQLPPGSLQRLQYGVLDIFSDEKLSVLNILNQIGEGQWQEVSSAELRT